jgi:hypothetical protein
MVEDGVDFDLFQKFVILFFKFLLKMFCSYLWRSRKPGYFDQVLISFRLAMARRVGVIDWDRDVFTRKRYFGHRESCVCGIKCEKILEIWTFFIFPIFAHSPLVSTGHSGRRIRCQRNWLMADSIRIWLDIQTTERAMRLCGRRPDG